MGFATFRPWNHMVDSCLIRSSTGGRPQSLAAIVALVVVSLENELAESRADGRFTH